MFSLFDPFKYVVFILHMMPLRNFSLAHEKSFKMTIHSGPTPFALRFCVLKSFLEGRVHD